MSVKKRVRNCDKFSTNVKLTYEGETDYGTLCGGVVSLIVRILIMTYFIIRTIDVIEFNDPAISSFTIIEDRSEMEEPLNFADYNQQLIFGF